MRYLAEEISRDQAALATGAGVAFAGGCLALAYLPAQLRRRRSSRPDVA